MKKIIFILISTLILSCTQNMEKPVFQHINFIKGANFLYCIDSKSPVIELSWDYPVKPGTDEWKQFQTHNEMVSACQIPEKILY